VWRGPKSEGERQREYEWCERICTEAEQSQDVKQFLEALRFYLRALEVRSGHTRAWLGAGRGFQLMGDAVLGHAFVNQALRSDPRNGRAWFAKGEFLVRDGMWCSALHAFTRSKENGYEDPGLEALIAKCAEHAADRQVLLGEVAMAISQGRHQDAVEVIDWKLVEDPADEQLQALLGRVLAAAGDIEGASQALKEAVDRGNDDPNVLCVASETAAAGGDVARAAALVDRALKKIQADGRAVQGDPLLVRWGQAKAVLDISQGIPRLPARPAALVKDTTNHLFGLSWSPDGSKVAALGAPTTIVYDSRSLEPVARLAVEGYVPISGVKYPGRRRYIGVPLLATEAISADWRGDSQALAVAAGNQVTVFNFAAGEQFQFDFEGLISAFDWMSPGMLAVCDSRSIYGIFPQKGRAHADRLPIDGTLTSICWNPHRNSVYCAIGTYISEISIDTFEKLWAAGMTHPISSVQLLAPNRLLVRVEVAAADEVLQSGIEELDVVEERPEDGAQKVKRIGRSSVAHWMLVDPQTLAQVEITGAGSSLAVVRGGRAIAVAHHDKFTVWDVNWMRPVYERRVASLRDFTRNLVRMERIYQDGARMEMSVASLSYLILWLGNQRLLTFNIDHTVSVHGLQQGAYGQFLDPAPAFCNAAAAAPDGYRYLTLTQSRPGARYNMNPVEPSPYGTLRLWNVTF
jgi:tetratricopeptide (TPR) repeat protein